MPTTEVRTQADIQNVPVRRYDDLAATRGRSRISWASVFAGSAMGLVTQLWLTILGVAIGASAIDPFRPGALGRIGVGGAIWLGISVIVSSYVGGWIAGRFAGTFRRAETVLHGGVSWAVSNLLAFLMIGTVFGAMMLGISNVAGAAAGAGAAEAIEQGRIPGLGRGQGQGQAPGAPQRQAPGTGQQQRPGGGIDVQPRQAQEAVQGASAGTSWGVAILMLLGLGSALWGASSATPMNSAMNRQR